MKTRWLAIPGTGLLILALFSVANAATNSTPVSCSRTATQLTCPLPAPVTVTAAGPTVTVTATLSGSAASSSPAISGSPSLSSPILSSSASAPASTGCLAAPSTCGYPDATNTGPTISSTAQVAWAGDYHTTADGQSIDGLNIRGTLYIDNSNVTVTNTTVTEVGSSGWAVVVGQHATAAAPLVGISISTCRLDGGKSDQGGITDPVGHSSWSMDRCDISNGENGIRPAGHARITNTYVHDLASSSSAPHYDCVEVYAGVGSVFDHDTLILNHDQTSALNVQGDFGPVDGTVLSNSLVDGGGWTLNIRNLAASVTGTKVLGNRFGQHSGFGYAAIDAPTTVSGNVSDSTGANIDSEV